MELFIQMGHQTSKLAIEHLEDFGSGTVILSPMNIIPQNIGNYASKVHKKNGSILVDPQLYYPRKVQKKLSEYAFWPQEDITALESGQFDKVVYELSLLNKEIEADMFLLPSNTTNQVDHIWNRIQKTIIESAKK